MAQTNWSKKKKSYYKRKINAMKKKLGMRDIFLDMETNISRAILKFGQEEKFNKRTLNRYRKINRFIISMGKEDNSFQLKGLTTNQKIDEVIHKYGTKTKSQTAKNAIITLKSIAAFNNYNVLSVKGKLGYCGRHGLGFDWREEIQRVDFYLENRDLIIDYNTAHTQSKKTKQGGDVFKFDILAHELERRQEGFDRNEIFSKIRKGHKYLRPNSKKKRNRRKKK